MRFSKAAFFALSCALVFAACDIPPEPVDEEDMTEFELQIKNIFYIENGKQLFMEYKPVDLRASYKFYEDYRGRIPFNPIDYITNLNPASFTPIKTEHYSLYCAVYSGTTASLPTQASLNCEKMVYIHTEEEGSGFPGLMPPEDWVATGKARIRVPTVPIHVLNSANSLATLETTSTPPAGVSSWRFAYADDSLILFHAYAGSNPVTYAFFRGSGTWRQVIDAAPGGAVKIGGKHHLLAGGALYESADGGSTWVKNVTPFLEGKKLTSICAGDGSFYVAYGTGVAVSADGGATWTETGTLPLAKSASDIAVLKGSLYLLSGTDESGGIFTSSNEGYSWTKLALVPSSYSTFFHSGDYLYCYTSSGLASFSGDTFKLIDSPISYESMSEGHGENGIFVTNFYRYGGYGINFNIGNDGPWYFLAIKNDYSSECRVIRNRIAFMDYHKLEIYRISGL